MLDCVGDIDSGAFDADFRALDGVHRDCGGANTHLYSCLGTLSKCQTSIGPWTGAREIRGPTSWQSVAFTQTNSLELDRTRVPEQWNQPVGGRALFPTLR